METMPGSRSLAHPFGVGAVLQKVAGDLVPLRPSCILITGVISLQAV